MRHNISNIQSHIIYLTNMVIRKPDKPVIKKLLNEWKEKLEMVKKTEKNEKVRF